MMRKKKYLAVLALLLIAAMVSTATLAYAPQNGKASTQSGQPGGKAQGKQAQKDSPKPNDNAQKDGTKGQEKSKPVEQEKPKQAGQEKPEQNGQGNGKQNKPEDQNNPNGVGKGPQGPKHLDLATIEASIAKLADENVKASLTALVAAYKTALANEQSGIASGADQATIAAYRKAVEDAKAAVLKALTGAGINGSETVATPSSLPKGQQKKLLDVEAIAASVAAVTDTQAQASLTALTETYKAAVANMESAWATGDDAAREASREAVKAAEAALLEALNSAGIEPAATPSSLQKPPQEQRVTGVWVAVVNWFSNLFGKLFK